MYTYTCVMKDVRLFHAAIMYDKTCVYIYIYIHIKMYV